MYEYLLSVAERIINSSVPPSVSEKYFELKKTLLAKSAVVDIKSNFVDSYCQNLVEEGSQAKIKFDFHSVQSEQFQKEVGALKKTNEEVRGNIQQGKVCQNETIKMKACYSDSKVSSIQKQNLEARQVFEDNKWLVEQLDKLLKENMLLRRMVGKDRRSS